jgi:glycosyltransferase involved in cell wall biosynthesis
MKLLIGYPYFPEPDTNSGSYRLFEIIRILRGAGVEVTFLARRDNGRRYVELLEGLGVRCFACHGLNHTLSGEQYRQLFTEGAFDCALLGPYFIYQDFASLIRAFLPRCRLILDTIDLHFVRFRRQAELSGTAAARSEYEEVYREELNACRDADQIWVVTQVERDTLAQEGCKTPSYLVPNIHVSHVDHGDFGSRRGIAFIGGYNHAPNVDAVHFFVGEVLPILRRLLPDVLVRIAGSRMPDELKSYQTVDANLEMVGFVEDHISFLQESRVGMAPLRYGAGMKGKIGEYFATGLPCVTTSVGAEGMSLTHGTDALIADSPPAFAACLAQVYTDENLWTRLSGAGITYIEKTLSPNVIRPLVTDAIQAAYAKKRAAPPINAGKRLRNLLQPGKWAGWCASSVSAVRNGGPRELVAQARIWLAGR